MRAELGDQQVAARSAGAPVTAKGLRGRRSCLDARHPATDRRQAIIDRERAKCLARGLVGRPVPALALAGSDGMPVQLDRAADTAVVFYLYPAVVRSPDGGEDSGAADGAQHRAFDRHRDDLRACSLLAIGISSESGRDQRERVLEHEIGHRLVSDSELQLARALGLPTFTHEGLERYRRLTIVAFAGRVAKAFFPVDSPERSAAQVIWWLQATGG